MQLVKHDPVCPLQRQSYGVLFFVALAYFNGMAYCGIALGDEYVQVTYPDITSRDAIPPPHDPSVCVVYGKNLNRFAKKNHPLSCERPVAEEFKSDIVRPKWEALNPLEHLDLLREIDRSLFYSESGVGKPKFDESKWLELKKRRYAEGRSKISVTKLDLNNDGYPENVLRYDYRSPCVPTRGVPHLDPSGIEYFLVDDTLTKFRPIITSAQAADIFIYRGNVYFEWMSYDGDIWVNERTTWSQDQVLSNVCNHRYLPDQCPSSQNLIGFAFVRSCQFKFIRTPRR